MGVKTDVPERKAPSCNVPESLTCVMSCGYLNCCYDLMNYCCDLMSYCCSGLAHYRSCG